MGVKNGRNLNDIWHLILNELQKREMKMIKGGINNTVDTTDKTKYKEKSNRQVKAKLKNRRNALLLLFTVFQN